MNTNTPTEKAERTAEGAQHTLGPWHVAHSISDDSKPYVHMSDDNDIESPATRRERHEYRLLNSHPDELGRADYIERRALLMARRKAMVGEELRRLAPADMRRRHRKNERHPCARA